MQNLIQRSISALVFAIIFIFSIIFSEKTYISLIIIFALVCLWEFSKMIKLKSIIPFIFTPLIIFYFSIIALKNTKLFLLVITIVFLIMLLYNLFSLKKYSIYSNTNKLLFSFGYIIFPFTFLNLLPFINGEYHPEIIISVIVLIWTNDSFAYLTGRKFGKNKLFESVSPKKTIEGFIGGLAFSIIIGIIIYNYLNIFSLYNWVIISVSISLIGTLGDLVESKFKRQVKIKDSGNIMPGHGGMLDRLDSLLFLSPFLYLYIHFFIQ